MNVIDLLLDALCIVEEDSTVVFVSPAFERIFGYTPQEAVGLRMLDLVHPDDLEVTKREAREVTQGELQLQFENRYVRKDGRIVHIRWTARRAKDAPLRVALAHDITDRKRSEARHAAVYAISEVAHTTEDLEDLFARVHAIVDELVAAHDLKVMLYDPVRKELTQRYPSGGACAPQPLDTQPRCAQVVRSGQTLLDNGDSPQSASSPPGAGLAPYWLGVPLVGECGVIGVLVLQGQDARYTQEDKALLQFVSTQVASAIEATQLRARLIHMAQFDALTDLPNRQLLIDRLEQALARARRGKSDLRLLFIDLDNFKQVNDSRGHSMGDVLLQQVAERLKACLRSSDTVARIGGDEFVVLLESAATPCNSEVVLRKICQAFDEPFLLGGHQVRVAASVGVAQYPEDGRDHRQLLAHADTAMYARKQARQAPSGSH